MRIVELDEKQFDSFSSKHPNHSYFQTSSYGKLMKSNKYIPLYLGLVDNYNNIIAATLVLGKKIIKNYKIGYCPDGFLIDYYNRDLLQIFTYQIKNYLKSEGYIYIKVNPKIVRSESTIGYSNFTTKKDSEFVINNLMSLEYKKVLSSNISKEIEYDVTTDLNSNIEELFASLNDEIKIKINTAKKQNIEIVRATVNDINTFYKLLEKSERNKVEYYSNLFQYFNKKPIFEIYFAKLNTSILLEKAKKDYEKEYEINHDITYKITNYNGPITKDIINAKFDSDAKLTELRKKLSEVTKIFKENPENIIIATCAIIKDSKNVYVVAEGSNNKYEKLCAKYLLKWDVIKESAILGYNEFNHGTIPRNFHKESYEYSKYNFKAGFNGVTREYIGEYNLIINPVIYMTYKSFMPLLKGVTNISMF